MKIAIIGSNSFLARYIIRELSTYHTDLALFGTTPSKEFPLLKFTLFKFPAHPINYTGLLENDVIIYCAGAGIQANLNETSEIIYELNSFIPIRLANELSVNNFKGKLITFGSYFEIGNEMSQRYYSENEIITSLNEASNHYCTSKRLLSRYLSSCPQTLNFYHLILPNIYGKGENTQRLIPYLVNAMANNEEVRLTSGEQIRQYIHATDIAKTVLNIINENYSKGFYNLCRNEAIQIRELAKKIIELCGHSGKLNNPEAFGTKERSDTAMPYLLLNNAKAVNTFRYQPKISLEEGIKTYLS